MKNTAKAFVLGVVSTAVLCTSGIALASNGYFKDGGWWTPAAQWTKDKGLMTGVQDDYFGGDQPVTRGQLAQVLKNLADTGAITINKPGSTTATPAPIATATPTPTATPTATTTTPAPAPAATSSGVTLANYNKIQKGMTLADVQKIFGSNGKVDSQSDSQYGSYAMYEWMGNAEYSWAMISFTDGKVTTLIQMGLV